MSATNVLFLKSLHDAITLSIHPIIVFIIKAAENS
jgi:hypothetical protein